MLGGDDVGGVDVAYLIKNKKMKMFRPFDQI